MAGALISLAACSPQYPEHGPCVQNSDCELCNPCGCSRVYSVQDIGTTTSCTTIQNSYQCPSTPPSDCISSGAEQGLCVSGHCQVVSQ